MDLNNSKQFAAIDDSDMYTHIHSLPDQLANAWRLGFSMNMPEFREIQQIIVAGMGGSAIGADLLGSFLADRLAVPYQVLRDYTLPVFAAGAKTLLIASSHSGNTEEVLSAFESGINNGCQMAAICTGGKLEMRANEKGIPVWKFDHVGQPRTAVGFSFALLMALLTRAGLIPDLSAEMQTAVEVMKSFQQQLGCDVPVEKNPAKRHAGNLVGRHVTVFASGFMAPVARRWKTQINELAKAFATYEPIPEADHNTLAGIFNPESVLEREYSVFIHASQDDPRNQLRLAKTHEIMMLEGLGTDIFHAKGETKLEQMWSSILFGDYLSYYLALAYDTDPTPIPPITALKEEMAK